MRFEVRGYLKVTDRDELMRHEMSEHHQGPPLYHQQPLQMLHISGTDQ